MGFDISNEFSRAKNEFLHDLIKENLHQTATCLTCGKVFNLYDNDKNMFVETCPVKINAKLKENREREMINMLGKYFCIWKV